MTLKKNCEKLGRSKLRPFPITLCGNTNAKRAIVTHLAYTQKSN